MVGVDPDRPAVESGLQTGDIILDIGGKTVANVAGVRKAITQAHDSGKHDVCEGQSPCQTVVTELPYSHPVNFDTEDDNLRNGYRQIF